MRLLDNRVLDRLGDRARSVASARVDDEDENPLLRRAKLLLEPDKTIVEAIVHHGMSRRQVATLLGLAPGQVTRRLQRAGARLNDPIVVKMLSPTCPVLPEYRQVGIEFLLQGLTLRAVAEKHKMTLAQVRRVVQMLRDWHANPACGAGGRSAGRAGSAPLVNGHARR